MPITPTYPGVYVEELSSGVRTIAGVSTSVTVFMGAARRGPIHKATPVRSYADFERRFGGLFSDSEMSYSVRQFFNNGGSEAIIIRVAANVSTAAVILGNAGNPNVLEISAADAGSAGNNIEIRVSHSPNPNNFSIRAILADPADPNNFVDEKLENLSLSSRDPRYAVTVINSSSSLIRARRNPALDFTAKVATSRSGEIDLTKIDDPHSQFRLSLNGGEPVTVDIADGVPFGNHGDLATKIQAKAKLAGSGPAYGADFKVEVVDTNHILITSGEKGEFASVRILPGIAKDASGVLKLGSDNGGVDKDGTADFRPAITPTAPSLETGAFAGTDLDAVPAATDRLFKITLDGQQREIDLGDTAVAGATVPDNVKNLAALIEQKVRQTGTGNAFTGLTATFDADSIKLTPGTTGATSSIRVNSGSATDVLDKLKLADNTSATGTSTRLANGTDAMFNAGNLQQVFIGSRALRTGLYALESVDIFNLLCMPGITNADVLAEAVAYCEERRAFLVADPPTGQTPDQMKTKIQGTDYPKRKNAAVYYPLIGISDPLAGGAMRMIAPSGTVAGVMARTDATRGVWKAPAGIDASMLGVQKLEYVLTDAENGVLNPRAVNCLRIFPNFGAVSWGARTLVGDDERGDEWKYIPVRRLALFIEESLYRGTKWAVFEPNDEPLWAQLRLNIGAFMHDLFRQGAFAGSSPRDAYLVKCDKETTTQSDINRGIVNILIGFAPLKPAEFVFLKIQQLAGQLTT